MFVKTLFQKVFIISFISFLLIGCGGNDTSDSSQSGSDGEDVNKEEEFEQELNIAYSSQPLTLDPHMTTAVVTSDMMRGVFETLVTVDADYNFQPMLADTYDVSEDGTVITFNLREGVLFHNGKEMTAEDVVASMNRWQELSNRADAFEGATFEAQDEYTVLLTLPEPMSTTFSVLTWMVGSYAAIMPKEVAEGASETGIEEYIGTGPFQFEEWKQDSYVKLSKFDDYQSRDEEASGLAGKKEALVDEVYFRIVTDPSTRVAGVMSGEYDIIHATPYDYAETIEENPNTENHTVPGSTYILVFNKKEGIFTDLKAREAAQLALDNGLIMQGAFTNEEYYTLNHNFVMPYLTNQFNSDAGKAAYEAHDPEQATEMFEELGYAGEEIVIITTRDYEEQYNASLVIQQELEKVGLNVKLEVYDWPTLLEKIEDPSAYDLNIMGWGPQPEPTSYGFLRRGYDSGWADSDEFDQLIEDFRTQPSLDQTADPYDAILQWTADHIPFIKTGDSNRIATTSTKVNNFQFQDGFIIWNMSVSK